MDLGNDGKAGLARSFRALSQIADVKSLYACHHENKATA
jgi:hypothetical protein